MTSSDRSEPLTAWLRDWQQAQPAHMNERLMKAVYGELRRVAAQRLAGESPASWTPTELVHETWLRLKPGDAPLADRNAFLRLASVAMRNLLVDQARERLAQKRHGHMQTITVSLAEDGGGRSLDDHRLLDLDRALDALALEYPRAAAAVALRVFGGLELDELAAALEISLATAKRDLAFGRAWLTDALKGASA